MTERWEALRTAALAALGSPSRGRFLDALAHRVAMAARGAYPEAGEPPDRAAVALRCHNELVLAVAAQRLADGGDGVPYPDDVFLEGLRERAGGGGCGAALLWALEQALRVFPGAGPPAPPETA